jgi:hypothetical protein
MADEVQIRVRRDVFEKLKSLAEPLVDDSSTVIERLIRHWEASPPKDTSKPRQAATQELWRSSRGDVLPVGAQLEGRYKGRTFAALVAKNGIRFEGKVYSTLSAAAIAAKGLAGTKGQAANTNGRDFWAVRDSSGAQPVPVSALRTYQPGFPIDAAKLLAELQQGK